MNLEQYETLKPLVAGQIVDYVMPVCRESLSVRELSNPTQDRTLLWGYQSNRDSFHVYLKDGQLHKVIYGYPDKLVFCTSGENIPCASLVPDKRAYPAACDHEFATLMLGKNQHVVYTTFDAREDTRFHGKLIEELQTEAQ